MGDEIIIDTDILIHICQFASNKTILNLLSCSKILHQSKKNVLFNDEVHVGTVYMKNRIPLNLWYYDNFTKINCGKEIRKIPLNTINLTFSYGFESRKLVKGFIPNGVKKITFLMDYYGESFSPGIFPEGLNSLLLKYDNCPQIQFNSLPKNLKKLILPKEYNHSIIDDTLPPNLIHLKFGDYFYQNIHLGFLPNTLQYLYLSRYSKTEIQPGVLPDSITDLIFGDFYNYSIQNIIGPNVINLTLGKIFTQKIKRKFLPKSLKYITLHNLHHVDLDFPVRIINHDCHYKLELGCDLVNY